MTRPAGDPLVDPRRAVSQMTDGLPFLLFPLRLETRFTPTRELLLRIYPDDCQLDTFDPVLTQSEVDAAVTYWAAPDDTAFAALVADFGAGRAGWIIETYKPDPATGDFPPVQTRPNAWSQPATVTTLPQRFVFLGYPHGGGEPLVALGNPVPATLQAGPDPGATGDDQIRHEDDNVVLPDGLRWVADFDAAVAVGMGIRIPLTEAQARDGFGRVIVLGVRIGADGQTKLEELLTNHSRGRKGLAIVPQGTPTNNTEPLPSGHSRAEVPGSLSALITATADWTDKRDGQWLAEQLGISLSVVDRISGADGTDQLTARAMNRALFPATLGYWMQTMLAPVFDAGTVAQTREFVHHYVLGSGTVPAIRIGNQPYGILPTTAFSRMGWLAQGFEARRSASQSSFLSGLYKLLRSIHEDVATQIPNVPRVGGAGDPHQVLLDVVGQHPSSVEWSQRYAESLTTLFNRLNLSGLGGLISEIIVSVERLAARDLLNRLSGSAFTGDAGEAHPPLLDRVFSADALLLKGPVIDDRPLSEANPIRTWTTDGRNYLTWLADAARTSHDALYQQNGFIDDRPPNALLYLILRHALQLSYHEVSIRLHLDSGLYSVEQAVKARADEPILHIRGAVASESRYQQLYTTAPQITGNPTISVGEFIGNQLPVLVAGVELREQLEAVDKLIDRPTAQLERSFADHVDTMSHRLDAWLLGMVNHQLALMRGLPGSKPTTGVHLGAYAWLEDLRPEHAIRRPKRLTDPVLEKVFNKDGDPTLTTDSHNQGYIHAPSLNHAVAAAVLRNGYLSTADPAHRDMLAVNLTSERVRTALATLEGIRAGQSLSDLLGYQLERGLHDRHGTLELDRYIYHLRKAFPLRADRMASTRTEEGVSIEAIEARNVVDGLALVEHMLKTGRQTYPFGKDEILPPTNSPAETAAISEEAARLLDTHDAVADLALAEGVYQAVLGNYDRVASTYDAYAHGRFPPEPDIIRTPVQGIGLTSRLALHLDAAPSTASPIGGVPMTPRALASPSVNAWLADVLPDLSDIGCIVSYHDTASGPSTATVALRDLALQPVDLLAIIRDDAEQAMSELDDRVTSWVREHRSVRPDTPLAIAYLDRGTAPASVFQVLPLLRALRKLVGQSRPLEAPDLSPATSAAAGDAGAIDPNLLTPVLTTLNQLRSDLAAFVAQLDIPLADTVANRETLLSTVDITVQAATGLLRRAATFGLPQSGWGFAHDDIRTAYQAIQAACAGLVDRWSARIAEFNDGVARYQGLPATMSDAERFRVLGQAERAITTGPLDPRPPDPETFRQFLQSNTLPAFQAKRQEFVDIASSGQATVAGLRTDVRDRLPITDFDAVEFTITGPEDGLITLIGQIRAVAEAVRQAAARRVAAVQDFVTSASTQTGRERLATLTSAGKALLGDEFTMIPTFTVSGDAVAGLSAALTASQSGEIFTYLAATDPFPVDTWLAGLARVRDKATAWETTQVAATALTGAEPELTALQIPHVPGEKWLGLEFPEEPVIEGDRLLYTAHFATPFDPAAPQCGLLLDEWSEMIPGKDVQSGLTFHFDRPNTEAPQTMLLVTPTQFRGGWHWEDIVDALNETLDLAKLRALEPRHLESLPYAWFLPATTMASQARQLTIAADLALNNALRLSLGGG